MWSKLRPTTTRLASEYARKIAVPVARKRDCSLSGYAVEACGETSTSRIVFRERKAFNRLVENCTLRNRGPGFGLQTLLSLESGLRQAYRDSVPCVFTTARLATNRFDERTCFWADSVRPDGPGTD